MSWVNLGVAAIGTVGAIAGSKKGGGGGGQQSGPTKMDKPPLMAGQQGGQPSQAASLFAPQPKAGGMNDTSQMLQMMLNANNQTRGFM